MLSSVGCLLGQALLAIRLERTRRARDAEGAVEGRRWATERAHLEADVTALHAQRLSEAAHGAADRARAGLVGRWRERGGNHL